MNFSQSKKIKYTINKEINTIKKEGDFRLQNLIIENKNNVFIKEKLLNLI
jgi:hypothetical protein